jgi:hypothetical protein
MAEESGSRRVVIVGGGLVLAEVTEIDAAGRRVLARRPLGEQLELGYDYLILAAGVRQSYFPWARGRLHARAERRDHAQK